MIIRLEVDVSKTNDSGPVEVAVVVEYLKEFFGEGGTRHEVGPDQTVVFELVSHRTDEKMVD